MNAEPRVAAVLAGGGGRRMGGVDKGALTLKENRLVDLVCQRLSAQVDKIVFAGLHDYGLGYEVIRDLEKGPRGPAAGLYAVAQALSRKPGGLSGFFTVPVDAPFFPHDLVARLDETKGNAVAKTEKRIHPTFAFWRIHDLLRTIEGQGSPSLKKIAEMTGAAEIFFEDETAFANINTRMELESARKQLFETS